MPLFALFIGIIIIVAAFRNSHAALFGAIATDAPKFIVWAAAIIALGVIGFIPGLKPVSRLLLALVIIVLVVNNYQRLTKGFQNAWQNPGDTASKKSADAHPAAAQPTDFISGFLHSNPFGNFLSQSGQ